MFECCFTLYLIKRIFTSIFYRKNYKIIVLGGLPASGKSTFANQLKDEFGYNILSPDDIKYNLAKIDNNLDKYESELVDILPKYNKKAWET